MTREWLPGLLALFALVPLPAWGQQSNDNFANRILLVGANIVTSASNVEATIEPGEPRLPRGSLFILKNTVWWSWTAPTNGAIRIAIQASGPDPFVAAYTGQTLDSLKELPFVENNNLSPADVDWVTYRVAAGAIYHIQVGARISTGAFELRLAFLPSPDNDSFAHRAHLGRGRTNLTASLAAASREPFEPRPAFVSDRFNSLWWSWTAPTRGPVTFTAEGFQETADFNARGFALTVYRGETLGALSLLSNSLSSSILLGQVSIDAEEGITYQISINGDLGFHGTITLNVSQSIPPVAVLTAPRKGSSFLLGSPITLAAQAFDPDGSIRCVDFYLAAETSRYRFAGSATEPPYALFWDAPAGSWHSVIAVARDNAGALGEAIPIRFLARPHQDDFANRARITGSFQTVQGSTFGATIEPGEPAEHAPSIWWSWTAPTAGPVTLTTRNSSDLAVYTGATLSSLVPIARATTDHSQLEFSRTVFHAAEGSTYHFALLRRWESDVQLHLAQSTPPVISITHPADQSSFSSGDSLRIVAEASDSDGTIARVDFYRDLNDFIGSVTNAPFAIDLTWTNSGSVIHRLDAVAVDDKGLSTRSAAVQVRVDPAPPPNDDFANRSALTGFAPSQATLAYATAESGEPEILQGQSVWWTWISPTSGPVTCSIAAPPGYSPVLGIFRGGAVDALTTIASNLYPQPDGSRVVFEAAAGETYVIGAGGFGGNSTVSLVPSHPPSVGLASPREFAVFPFGTNILLAAEASDPDGHISTVQFFLNQSLVGAAATAPYTILLTNASAGFHAVVAVATDNSGLISRSLPSAFQVLEPIDPPPSNDLFENRISLTGSPLSVADSARGATFQSYEPPFRPAVWYSWSPPISGPFTIVASNVPALSIFTGDHPDNLQSVTNLYASFGAISEGILNAQRGTAYQFALGANLAPYALAILPGVRPAVRITSPAPGAAIIGSANFVIAAETVAPDGSPISRVDFFVDSTLAGVVHNPPFTIEFPIGIEGPIQMRIRAVATNDRGLTGASDDIFVTVFPPPPANDAFIDSAPLSGFAAFITGQDQGSSTEPGEPSHPTRPDKGTVWWSWTAPASGWALVTARRDHLGALRVYSGDRLSNLKLVAFDQPAEFSPALQTRFFAVAATTYQISLERGQWGGQYALSLLLDTPRLARVNRLASADILLRLFALPGGNWTFEASTNLLEWIPIATYENVTGSLDFLDPAPIEFRNRFYRAWSSPEQ